MMKQTPMIAKLAVTVIGLAAFSLPVAAQGPVTPPAVEAVLNPGVALKAPPNAALTALAPIPNLLVGSRSKNTWSLERGDPAPFYYARYTVSQDTRVNKGTAKAGTDLYGVYYNAGNGTSKRDGDWVVKPEWSGLFPLTTDNMLVRAAGTDTWYVLQTRNGSTMKLGEGQIGSAEIVDLALTGGANLYGDEFHYLITADDGERQTIRLIQWSERSMSFSLGEPIDQVVPAAVLGESPVKVLLRRDTMVRRYWEDGKLYDTIVYKSPSKIDKQFARTTLGVTHPFKQAMYIIDAEKQLYAPIEMGSDLGSFYYVRSNKKNFLGYRPIGSGITSGLKDNPLEAFPNGAMATVWQTKEGILLVPMNGMLRGYYRSHNFWGLPDKEDGNIYFTPYRHAHAIGGSNVGYTALYPIAIPEEIRRYPDPTLALHNGVYGVNADGTVNVYFSRVGVEIGHEDGNLDRAHPGNLESMDAARTFVEQALTLEGRRAFHAFRLKIQEERVAKMAESQRQKEAARQAAIKAMYDREAAARKATTDAIRARLNSGDFYGAMTLASTSATRDLPSTLVYIMNSGRSDMISLNLAEAGLQYASEDQARVINSRIRELRPAPAATFRAAPSSSPSSSSSSNSQGQILNDAQQRSRDSYNSGHTGSYLCGAASFCN